MSRRNLGSGNGDGVDYENRNNVGKPLSTRNLRRRHNATTIRKDGEPDTNGTAPTHGFPKSIRPFVHKNDTSAVDAELDNYSQRSSESPQRDSEDVEAGPIQNTTITFGRENSMHASFLTADSVSNFDFSGNISIDSSTKEEKKTLKSPPSYGSDHKSKSFRKKQPSSYDSANDDENLGVVDSDQDTDTDNENNAKTRKVPDPNTWWGKFYKSRRIVGRLVNNEYVQMMIIILIVANGILIGFSTTQRVEENGTEDVIATIDLVFLIIFTIEIVMQLYYYAFALFLDAWLVFDLIVVIVSWVAEAGESNGNDLQVLRAFRIFRVTRLVTRVKPLRDLVLALGKVLPRMSAIMLLLIVVFYVFAVLFTEQFSAYEMEYNYFTTLHDSFLTCFQMMTMEWVDICRPLMEEHEDKYAWVTIVIFVMLAGFIVFNLIVAVVVEAVSATEEDAKKEEGIESPSVQLKDAEDRCDLLTSHMNEMIMQQEHIQRMLEVISVELLQTKAEQLKAERREKGLKGEIERRIENERKIEEEKRKNTAATMVSMKFLQKIQANREKKAAEEAALAAASDSESFAGHSAKKKRRPRSFSRDGSGKSLDTNDSIGSFSDNPGPSNRSSMSGPSNRSSMSGPSNRTSIARPSSRTSTIRKKSDSSTKSEENPSERKRKAVGNWKKLLAVQKELDI